jgi:precorrin-2/cobalt-factor-2 C20-methyltransferase
MTPGTLGTLYGIGVGPGDPELMTLKAARILGQVDTIFAAASPKNDDSIAMAAATPHVKPGATIQRLDFPMTHDAALLRQAWETNADIVLTHLQSGSSAAFLTLGDPLTYSTFGYLLTTLRQSAPEIPVEIVPGISSPQAAAALSGRILTESRESLLILPGLHSAEELKQALSQADNVVILKAYRNFPAIREALRGEERDVLLASQVGLDGERMITDLDSLEEIPAYMSLILVTRRRG